MRFILRPSGSREVMQTLSWCNPKTLQESTWNDVRDRVYPAVRSALEKVLAALDGGVLSRDEANVLAHAADNNLYGLVVAANELRRRLVGEVISYVTQKYGRDNVAQIITFGTMAAKAAIKDVGRAMDIPYADVDRIAKMVPTQLNITLEQAIADSAQLREAIEKDGQIRELFETAKKLEGMVRNSGVHAAGVVISPRPLTDLVPLHRTKNDEIVTAFDMTAIEKLGLLKMDFLGLTTLTILDDSLKLIKQHRNQKDHATGDDHPNRPWV